MSAATPRAYSPVSEYSNNLLPALTTFVDTITFNIDQDSGDGDLVLTQDTAVQFKGTTSLKAAVSEFVGGFDAIGEFLTTVTRDGIYILSLKLLADTSLIGKSVNLVCNVIVNDVAVEEFSLNVLIENNDMFEFGVWNTFYEKFNLSADDTIDITFSVDTEDTGFEFYIDALKLELDDRNLEQPTIYSAPLV